MSNPTFQNHPILTTNLKATTFQLTIENAWLEFGMVAVVVNARCLVLTMVNSANAILEIKVMDGLTVRFQRKSVSTLRGLWRIRKCRNWSTLCNLKICWQTCQRRIVWGQKPQLRKQRITSTRRSSSNSVWILQRSFGLQLQCPNVLMTRMPISKGPLQQAWRSIRELCSECETPCCAPCSNWFRTFGHASRWRLPIPCHRIHSRIESSSCRRSIARNDRTWIASSSVQQDGTNGDIPTRFDCILSTWFSCRTSMHLGWWSHIANHRNIDQASHCFGQAHWCRWNCSSNGWLLRMGSQCSAFDHCLHSRNTLWGNCKAFPKDKSNLMTNQHKSSSPNDPNLHFSHFEIQCWNQWYQNAKIMFESGKAVRPLNRESVWWQQSWIAWWWSHAPNSNLRCTASHDWFWKLSFKCKLMNENGKTQMAMK